MNKRVVLMCMITGLLALALSGCQEIKGTDGDVSENASEPIVSAEADSAAESESTEIVETKGPGAENQSETETSAKQEDPFPDLPYQFVRKYGIVKAEDPVYELDAVVESKIPEKEKSMSLTFAVNHKQELIVTVVLDDYSEVEKIPADGEPPAGGSYINMPDGTRFVATKYQYELWEAGEGLFLTGPDLPEEGIKPTESNYMSYPDYMAEYGTMRYFIEARFELPAALTSEERLSGYGLRVLDFEQPLEFALKQAPEYETLEALAAGEDGGLDTHDGVTIISMGEPVEEGLLVTWYVCSEAGDRRATIIFKPPFHEVEMPVVSSGGVQYPIKQLAANPYGDAVGSFRLSDVKLYGARTRCVFDVPRKEQNASLQIQIPGITFLEYRDANTITLTIPEDYEELNEDIAWNEGSVRILGITRMTERQKAEIQEEQGKSTMREMPAVYIDVKAVKEDKELALRHLICERQSQWGKWEHQRYDYNENGDLSGFRIFIEEGGTSVALRFTQAAFFWKQPYVMEVPLAEQPEK